MDTTTLAFALLTLGHALIAYLAVRSMNRPAGTRRRRAQRERSQACPVHQQLR